MRLMCGAFGTFQTKKLESSQRVQTFANADQC